MAVRGHGSVCHAVRGVWDRDEGQGSGLHATRSGSSAGTGADRAKRPSRVSNLAPSIPAHAMESPSRNAVFSRSSPAAWRPAHRHGAIGATPRPQPMRQPRTAAQTCDADVPTTFCDQGGAVRAFARQWRVCAHLVEPLLQGRESGVAVQDLDHVGTQAHPGSFRAPDPLLIRGLVQIPEVPVHRRDLCVTTACGTPRRFGATCGPPPNHRRCVSTASGSNSRRSCSSGKRAAMRLAAAGSNARGFHPLNPRRLQPGSRQPHE